MSKTSRIAVGIALVAVLGCAVGLSAAIGKINGSEGADRFSQDDPGIVRARSATLPELTRALDEAVKGLSTYGRFQEDDCNRGKRGPLDPNPDDYQWSCDITVAALAGVHASRADVALKALRQSASPNCSTDPDPSGVPLPDIDAPSDEHFARRVLSRTCFKKQVRLELRRADDQHLPYAVPRKFSYTEPGNDFWTFVPSSQPDPEAAVAQLRADGYRYALVAEVTQDEYYEVRWPAER